MVAIQGYGFLTLRDLFGVILLYMELVTCKQKCSILSEVDLKTTEARSMTIKKVLAVSCDTSSEQGVEWRALPRTQMHGYSRKELSDTVIECVPVQPVVQVGCMVRTVVRLSRTGKCLL